jgi:hypothetical protein
MKDCTNIKCAQNNPQPAENFYYNKNRKDKLRPQCIACTKKAAIEYHKNNKTKGARISFV